MANQNSSLDQTLQKSRKLIVRAEETIRRARETLRVSREVQADRDRSGPLKADLRGRAVMQDGELAK